MDVIILIFGIILIVGMALFAVSRVLRRIVQKREAALRERFPNAHMLIPMANCFGQESKGVGQMRGNGVLVVTHHEIVFEMLVPQKEWHIPFSTIQAVETVKSHLGKTVGRSLLKIRYTNEQGQADSIAWFVPHLAATIETLQAIRQAAPPSMAQQSEAAARARFPHAKAIITDANLFGQESKGVSQIGGIGLLAVTETEVYFERYLPKAEFHIPLTSIQSIEIVERHMGKSIGRPLLKLTFTNEQGQADSIAWWVADVESFQTLLESAR